MVPRVRPSGSTAGESVDYLGHDPSPDGGTPRPRTAERVAHIGVRNLPRGPLEDLVAIIETTVQDASSLKFLAGVVAQGAKLRNSLHHYVLSWAPDENPELSEILDAVSESLVVQELEDHQAIFFVHTDTDCIHVHVLVNRVHSDTGLAANVSRTGKHILSPWARSWEERHGGVRCRRRPTPEETRAWDELLTDQRAGGIAPEIARLERQALTHYIDECRAARGESPAARSGRATPCLRPRREFAPTQEEKALWAELFERHRREDTPEEVRRQERRELAQRVHQRCRAMEKAVRERAAAVDIDIDVLVDAKDAPRDAGRPRSMERWSYVQEIAIPVAEENLRAIVGARRRDHIGWNVDELASEPSYRNGHTQPDSLERYRYWDTWVDVERGGNVCTNLPVRERDEVARCQHIRRRAVDAGVPHVDAYAQAEPVPSQMAATQYDRFLRAAVPHGGGSGTSLRWTYIERHVIPRWETLWAAWNAAPRPRRRAVERKPAAVAPATHQGSVGNGLVGPVWMFRSGPGVKVARDAGRTRPVEPARPGAVDVTQTAAPDPSAAPVSSRQIAEEAVPDGMNLGELGRSIRNSFIDVYRHYKARRKEKRRVDAEARFERAARISIARVPTAGDRDRVSPKSAHGPAEPQSAPQELTIASGEAAAKAPREPSEPSRKPVRAGGNEDFAPPPERSSGRGRGRPPGSQEPPLGTRGR